MRINLRNTLYQIGLSTALCLIGVCMLPSSISALCAKLGSQLFATLRMRLPNCYMHDSLVLHTLALPSLVSALPAAREVALGALLLPLQGACVAADAALKCDFELLVHPVDFSAESFFLQREARAAVCLLH